MRHFHVRQLAALLFLFLVLVSMAGLRAGLAEEEPNVGVLRIVDLKHPRQVAPSAQVSFVIDVEYAIKTNATIRSALFEGSPGNLGGELWHSEPELLSAGGDKLWTVNLNAPSSEQEWTLTAFAYYLDAGEWKYYTDSDQGPGFMQIVVKIAPLAALEVDLGYAGVPVKIDDSTTKTSALGSVVAQLPVGVNHQVEIQSIVTLENSTRLVFVGWADGSNATQRTVMLDGDSKLSGSYKAQYLLKVNSIVPVYSFSGWYDSGTNVTLSARSVIPMDGVLGALGMRYIFNGWSGDVQSGANTINITMDRPRVINADFTPDLTTVVIPAVILVGIIGAVILMLARRRRPSETVAVETETGTEPEKEEEEVVAPQVSGNRFCDGCGKPVEKDWTHCVHCGKALGSSETVEN